jgi:hypothetical protein
MLELLLDAAGRDAIKGGDVAKRFGRFLWPTGRGEEARGLLDAKDSEPGEKEGYRLPKMARGGNTSAMSA